MNEKLQEAKENVIWLLDNPTGSVDMHGLEFWAREVERVREAIIKNL